MGVNSEHITEGLYRHGMATLVLADCIEWLGHREPRSIHAVVTDPPYGLVEYTEKEQAKLRKGRGGFGESRPPSMGTSAARSRVSRP